MTPDARAYEDDELGDTAYLRSLCKRIGLPQQDIAKRLGIGYRTLQGYLGSSGPKCPYPVQFCLEVLAKNGHMDVNLLDKRVVAATEKFIAKEKK